MSGSARLYSGTVKKLMTCPAQKVQVADAVTELVLRKEITVADTPAIMYDLLIKQWKYLAVSYNLDSCAFNAEQIISSFAKWKAFDIVFMYHHPDLGAMVINPKNPAHKEYISDFKKNEMLVIFMGYQGKKPADDLCAAAQKKCMDIICGKKTTVPENFLKGSYSFKKDATFEDVSEETTNVVAASSIHAKKGSKKIEKIPGQKISFSIGGKSQADAPKFSFAKYNSEVKTQPRKVTQSSITGNGVTAEKKITFMQQCNPQEQKVVAPVEPAPQVEEISTNPNSIKKMSPMLSVVVTNELFHNGNVEAWKKIIASFTAKYPDLQIWVYYDGERITDINALFKWGKVKHGSCIQFVVVGENIQDVAKLKRYFTQGASPMFEAFLQGAPGTILNLF